MRTRAGAAGSGSTLFDEGAGGTGQRNPAAST
ncbi:hypothetical protein SAMN05421867_1041, partial [Cellulomonas marina]